LQLRGSVQDYGPAVYVAHRIVSFNGQNSFEDYKLRIEAIIESIVAKLEQEIYENPSWVINFDHNEVLDELHKLKSSLSLAGKPFIKLRFVNTGNSQIYDSIDGGYLHTEIKDVSVGLTKFKLQLDKYSELLKAQIDILYASLSITFSKFLYNKGAYLDNAKKTIGPSNIHDLRRLLREGNVNECIKKLSELFSKNSVLSDIILMIEVRFNANRNDKKMGIISLEEFKTTENRIIHAIVEILNSQKI